MRFSKIIRSILFVLIAMLLVECGGSDSGKDNASAENSDYLSGKWDVSYNDISSSIGACGTTSGIYINTITINQSGTKISLTLDDYATPINGTLEGDTILANGTIQLENGSTCKFNFNLTFSVNFMDGEYYWSRGEESSSCSGEDWISATKSANLLP